MHVYFVGLHIFLYTLCMFYLYIYVWREFYLWLLFCILLCFSQRVRYFCSFTTFLYILHCVYLHYWSYTSHRLMLFVVKTTWNKAYSILFYSIQHSSGVTKLMHLITDIDFTQTSCCKRCDVINAAVHYKWELTPHLQHTNRFNILP